LEGYISQKRKEKKIKIKKEEMKAKQGSILVVVL